MFEGCRAFLTTDSTFLLEGERATNVFAVGRGLTPLEGGGWEGKELDEFLAAFAFNISSFLIETRDNLFPDTCPNV